MLVKNDMFPNKIKANAFRVSTRNVEYLNRLRMQKNNVKLIPFKNIQLTITKVFLTVKLN